jgi:DNA mismatch repair protein MutL
MSKYINILPERVVNKIAAGEVIQRPESAVKELIENSIDAGSTEITLLVKDSGKTLIQIIDNGSGMYPEDAEICFIRHSTSKIFNEQDLDGIHTLGFRGEALASMASVAQVELKTKTDDAELGTLVLIENSKVTEMQPVACERGTSISVKNLYYNTPARRNFLKSDSTELKHIMDTFLRFCICYPEIKFVLVNNESKIYQFEPADYFERITAVFKNQKKEDLIQFAESLDFMEVKGFICKPRFLKKNRGDQFLFLNRRYIQNRMVNHAVSSSYETIAKVSGYPFFVMFLTIDPSRIDVNVHPAKLEVKFDDERSIHHIVSSVIKKALANSDLTPELNFQKTDIGFGFERNISENFQAQNYGQNQDKWNNRPSSSGNNNSYTLNDYPKIFGVEPKKSSGESEESQDSFLTFESPKSPVHEKSSIAGPIVPQNVWQIQEKYIIARISSGILIIDQHVAHERILYEKALKFQKTKIPLSQQLLFPITIDLSPVDYQIVKELYDDLQNLGFEIKLFSETSVVLDGIPADVKLGNEENILKEIIYDIRNNREPNIDAKDYLARTFACKAAIKFGDTLNQTEMVALIDQLFATEVPYVCPHGRPVIIKISVDELDKKFGRK